MKDRNPLTDETLATLMRGYIISQLIAAAVRFKIPDHLAEQSLTSAQLAAVTEIRVSELRRYLRALVGIGLVDIVAPDLYHSSDLARHLRRVTGSLYGHAMMSGGEYYDAWRHFDYALLTGKSGFEVHHGKTLWEHFSENASTSAAFTRTMRWNMNRAMAEILSIYQFPGSGTIADLGAGDGTFLISILERLPNLRGIAFEQPAVIGHTARHVHESSVSDRCEVVAGDFLITVPQGANVYMLKAVIHNWNDEDAISILRNCRRAIGSKPGRLVLIERGPDGQNALNAAVRDLTMLVLFGGMDRSADECGELLNQAGFVTNLIEHGSNGLFIVEALAT